MIGAVAALVVSTPAATASTQSYDDYNHDDLRTVVAGLDGPRGVAVLGRGQTLVTESDGTFSLVVERGYGSARVVELGRIPTEFPPAIDVGPHGDVYILTTESEQKSSTTASKLYLWKSGWRNIKVVADIAAYQKRDPDPYDVEKKPTDSNPFGLEALADGTVLVADAGANDLLRVGQNGGIQTVARLKPRYLTVPTGLPTADPEGRPTPKAGTTVPSEAVPTSVTVGADGYWYVGELRGFPATPGTSQVWRIKPGAVGAVCDPSSPDRGDCRRYADGLTSIVDLAATTHGSLLALSLSKMGWLRMELNAPGAKIGGLFEIKRSEHRYDDRVRYDNGYDHRYDDRYRDRDWEHDRDRHTCDWRDYRYDHERDGQYDHERDGQYDHERDARLDERETGTEVDERETEAEVDERDARLDDQDDVRSYERDDDSRDDEWRNDEWRYDHCDHDGYPRHDSDRYDPRNGDSYDRDGYDRRYDDQHAGYDHRYDDRYDGRHAGYDHRYDDRYDHRYDDRYDHRYDDRYAGYDHSLRTSVRELAVNQLVQPGGVDVASDGDVYITGPIFGPGALMKLDN